MFHRSVLALFVMAASLVIPSTAMAWTPTPYTFSIGKVTLKDIPEYVDGFSPVCFVVSTATEKSVFPDAQNGATVYATASDGSYLTFFKDDPKRRANSVAGPFEMKAERDGSYAKADTATHWWCGLLVVYKSNGAPTPQWPTKNEKLLSLTSASAAGALK